MTESNSRETYVSVYIPQRYDSVVGVVETDTGLLMLSAPPEIQATVQPDGKILGTGAVKFREEIQQAVEKFKVLQERRKNGGLVVKFKNEQVDATCFKAVVYRDGDRYEVTVFTDPVTHDRVFKVNNHLFDVQCGNPIPDAMDLDLAYNIGFKDAPAVYEVLQVLELV